MSRSSAVCFALALIACLLCSLPSPASALSVYVPAKDSQCFFEFVSTNDKVVGSYWVSATEH